MIAGKFFSIFCIFLLDSLPLARCFCSFFVEFSPDTEIVCAVSDRL